MRALLLTGLLLSLVACDQTAPTGSTQLGMLTVRLDTLGTDSLRDSMVLQSQSAPFTPVGNVWVRFFATHGTVTPQFGQTDAGGRLSAEWRLPKPSPGIIETLTVCVAVAGGALCVDTLILLISHDGNLPYPALIP